MLAKTAKRQNNIMIVPNMVKEQDRISQEQPKNFFTLLKIGNSKLNMIMTPNHLPLKLEGKETPYLEDYGIHTNSSSSSLNANVAFSPSPNLPQQLLKT